MGRKLLLGCIADDFTGAGDAASFIVKSGMKTMLFNGVPEKSGELDVDAVVIALKTRTDGKRKAVSDSLKAIDWLVERGAEHIYSKYCSTFDSTPEGNIGPIMDAILERCGVESSILCPALPVNGRTVSFGKLYVNGVPLSESSMKEHPLTPMWESDIEKLMKPQSGYPCIKIDQDVMRRSRSDIQSYIEGERKKITKAKHYYLIPDYVEEGDAEKIAEVFGDMKVLSGGSGILTELGKKYLKDTNTRDMLKNGTKGRGIILAGSCSAATLNQIKTFGETGNYMYKINPLNLLDGTESVESIWRKVESECEDKEILIYSSDSPEQIKKIQNAGKEKIASVIEKTISELAVKAEESGYKRIIVAGGETSGAVSRALGYRAYYIGESIAPGVPVMIPAESPKVRLALKSGNFGQPDFFLRALKQTSEK